MRTRFGMALACLLAAVFGLMLGGVAAGEEEEDPKADERKTTARPTVQPPPTAIDVDLIWNFYYQGKKRKGDVVEFVQLDAPEHHGRTLVITHLDMRTRQSTRAQIVEYRKEKSRRAGRPVWKKMVRRGEAFSMGWQDSTSQWVASGFSSLVGMKFGPGTRPSLEITHGSGDIWVYAEGYWSSPPAKKPQ